ncbi:tRNA dimethylallyltransferase 2 isoform X2 [Olea europaea subsp. europaea]|uniref:tRNA dimethylallyltransferase 2 isoform X2 n=1 Tax=Olea europaea subsp. europaea TaxID=158383 RepID=A0A8S0PYC7_OLEEU|nr:tRNA dimethylallyltransferase 2 isoform X2 [Olea europaea subsp. europaea]
MAIDLASHFPIEIINADFMQVYQGLDVLTNKVPVQARKGMQHHLLGTVSPNVAFTAKDFRDCAIPALVSQFLLDDYVKDQEADYLFNPPGDKKPDFELEPKPMDENGDYTYSHLKDLDLVAANRIHPNDHRKKRTLSRLQMLFGWNIRYVDVSGCLFSALDYLWVIDVVEPSLEIIKSFLDMNNMEEARSDCEVMKLAKMDLCTQYTCQACGNKVLRGGHEWEQHKQGRSHRKRVSRFKMSGLHVELPHDSTMQ